MTDELKPVRCGCGGEMLMETIGNPVFGWRLRCPKWHIMTSWFDSEAEAIEAWNRAMGERTEKIHDDKIRPVIHRCGKDIVTLINPTWNYCPYCGTKFEWI